MRLFLSGLWQLSPLTDLSIPQDDLIFPGALRQVLPSTLSDEAIHQQEWHLMYDIEIDESVLAYPAIDFVLSGIDYHAEVRLNGVALFDCDQTASTYRKDIRGLLLAGGNRFEILFLHQDDQDFLLEQDNGSADDLYLSGHTEMGIWSMPVIECMRHIRLHRVSLEQIWHDIGGCEVLVTLFFECVSPGLVSTAVTFDGRTYTVPIDVRANSVSILFQEEAPKDHYYPLEIKVDDQHYRWSVALTDQSSVTYLDV